MAVNQYGAPSLIRGVSFKFWMLRSANNVKFTEERVVYKEKHVFVQNILTNGLNIFYRNEPESKRRSVE